MVQILEAALCAADPYYNTLAMFRREGDFLYIGGKEFEASGDPRSGVEVVDLRKIDHIFVVGAAKGIQRIAKAIEERLGDALTGGHVIGKYGDEIILERIGVTLAAHPVPDENCIRGCQEIVKLAEGITERDLVITIIGNGGSSLLTYPADGITLQEVVDFTHMMQIEKGVPTHELNIIRNHIDRMKGGRLSKLFYPAKLICLDCVDANDHRMRGVRENWDVLMHENKWLHNLPDQTTFAEAMEVIENYQVEDRCPKSILKHLQSARPEDDTVHFDEFMNIDFRMFGIMPLSKDFIEVGKRTAESLGYRALTFAHVEAVEARAAARIFSSVAKHTVETGEPFKAPVALFIGEEMVVATGNSKGVGGRNQEYALTFASLIDGIGKITVGAVDTDGTDGPGGLALEGAPDCLGGGVIDGYTMEEARRAGVDVRQALKAHATSEALWRVGCGVHLEHNVSMGDLSIILIDE
ncbi:MAG: DUF4147 domain-containing protein [Spirochaetaceae bacterium]|nr:DUF4147 domain-containing protein [Spirochaetaceae bacterium]